MKFTSERLKQELSTIIDPFFAGQLVDSYVEMMQRFYAGDWKPSELDSTSIAQVFQPLSDQLRAELLAEYAAWSM